MPACVWTLILSAAAASAFQEPPGQEVDFYPKEREAALGAQFADEVRKPYTIVESAAVRGYVERIGQRLAAQLAQDDIAWTFDVIACNSAPSANPTHEPLSLPGGYVFVPSGLFLAAQDEAEFAGMVAHAIAHAARHGIRQAADRRLVNVGSVPMVFLGGWSTVCGGDPVVPVAYLGSARQYELHADKMATRMMAGAGFDPAGMLRYIERRQTDAAGQAAKFSPLPPREIRIAGLAQAIEALGAGSYSASGDFSRIQEEIRRMTSRPARAPSLRQTR